MVLNIPLTHSMIRGVEILVTHHSNSFETPPSPVYKPEHLQIRLCHDGTERDLDSEGPTYRDLFIIQATTDHNHGLVPQDACNILYCLKPSEQVVRAVLSKKRHREIFGYYLELGIKLAIGIQFKNLLIKEMGRIRLN